MCLDTRPGGREWKWLGNCTSGLPTEHRDVSLQCEVDGYEHEENRNVAQTIRIENNTCWMPVKFAKFEVWNLKSEVDLSADVILWKCFLLKADTKKHFRVEVWELTTPTQNEVDLFLIWRCCTLQTRSNCIYFCAFSIENNLSEKKITTCKYILRSRFTKLDKMFLVKTNMCTFPFFSHGQRSKRMLSHEHSSFRDVWASNHWHEQRRLHAKFIVGGC